VADTAVTWRGLTIGGGGDYHVEEITGWDDMAELDDLSQARTRGHGDNPGDLFSRARIVTVSGSIASLAARDALALALMSASPVSSAVEDLTVETFGRSLTAGARLIRRSLPVGENYAAGAIPFALQWRCPDPRRYSPTVTSLSTNLQQPGGGIAPPWTPPLVLPARAAGGYLIATNPGTAPTPLLAVMTGPQETPGVLNATTNQILRYGLDLGTDDVLAIDTERGVAILNGTAYRQPLPGSTITRDFQLPQGTSDLQAIGVGTGVGTPRMDLSFRAASW
jgi:hypothetical protein